MPVDASVLRMFPVLQILVQGSETSVLQYLLKLGRTDVLDAFRSYVYYGNVTGSPDAGLGVSANTATDAGQNNQVTYSGTAGGFGGSLLNGSVKNSSCNRIKLCNRPEQRRWLCRILRKKRSCKNGEAGCAGR